MLCKFCGHEIINRSSELYCSLLCSKKYHKRIYREKHRDKIRAERKRWRATHKTEILTYQRAYYDKNKKSELSHWKVQSAIRSGKLIRPDHCSICSVKVDPVGHHNDYAEPLKVIWVCSKCHFTVFHPIPRAVELKTERIDDGFNPDH